MNIQDMTWLPQEHGDLFGRRVAAWLAMPRIGHTELATATGTDKWGLSRALNGKRAFPVTLALAVSHYTGLPLTGTTVTYNPDRAHQTPATVPAAGPGHAAP
jgi:hypothetical protein